MQNTPVIVRRRSTANEKEPSFNFSPQISTDDPEFIQKYRKQSWKAFLNLPMPSNEEAWRRINFKEFHPEQYRLGIGITKKKDCRIPNEIISIIPSKKRSGQIVLTPSGCRCQLLDDLEKDGIVLSDLVSAKESHPHLLGKVAGRIINPSENKYAALAGAMASQGMVLYVPKGKKITKPFHYINWIHGNNSAFFSHVLISLEEDSQATVILEVASPETGQNLVHSGLVEIILNPRSRLELIQIQSLSKSTWNFSTEKASLAKTAELDWIHFPMGSGTTKCFMGVDLAGEGARASLSGMYFPGSGQHIDLDTKQNHFAPNTFSDLLFKGAVIGKGRSVWHGMIFVSQGAEKTDGYQANRNLILSADAKADSIPGLEILTDDVRCTHAATLGNIEEEPLYYLQSRGIPRKEAEGLIVNGFFEEILNRTGIRSIRSRVEKYIARKINHNEQ